MSRSEAGVWLVGEVEETLDTMSNDGFNVRAVVTGNHSVNVFVFKTLRAKYREPVNVLRFNSKGHKIYNLYDGVHLIKNVRNNPLRAKRFIYAEFDFADFEDVIHVEAGEISWRLFHEVYEKDETLLANLKKAPKLSQKTLHPGNNKQSVSLALNIFHESILPEY